ncbi:MAG: tRNA lysidine(34) synthetase TilS [bacterium]
MSRSVRTSLPGRFLETVEREGLLPVGSRVLVAVSGGADSVALFELLRIVAPGRGLVLAGFHMNHHLRTAAGEDEDFVRQLFARAGVELRVVRSDVRRFARRHQMGLEAAGRQLRYRHLARLARLLRSNLVALGHTADDNLETILLNLCRGSGLAGLSGIPCARDPCGRSPFGRIVRPLIDLTRAEIEDWLCARGVNWREDESNTDERFARNFVRRRVVPLLRRVSPSVAAAARRTARLVAADDDYLDLLARQALGRSVRVRIGRLEIDVAAFNAYNSCLRRRIARHLAPALDSAAVERVLVFLAGSKRRLEPGGGIEFLRRQKGTVECRRSPRRDGKCPK